MAFAHPYLLHQILAVAALHRYTETRSRSDFANTAMHHRAQALEGVQAALADTSTDSSVSLFAFAGLTAIYAFGELAISVDHGGVSTDDIVGRLIACVQLSRGISTIVDARRNAIHESWAREMITLNAFDDLALLRSSGLKLGYTNALRELVHTHTSDSNDAAAYIYAAELCLEYIQLLLYQRDEADQVYHLIMTWPSEVPPRYLELLGHREPIALVVLAHFAVLMHMRPRLWWLAQWPGPLLEQISHAIDAEWERWLEWPRMMLNKTERALSRTISE